MTAMRRLINLLESVELTQTTERDAAIRAIRTWFGQHDIVEKDNLASPLELFGLSHTEDITIRLRDWSPGKVDAITRYRAVQPEFEAFAGSLGWHVTMESSPLTSNLGTVVSLRVAPNFPARSVEVPRILHHLTAARNLDSILQHGIQLRAQRPSDRYPPRIYLMLPDSEDGWTANEMLKAENREGWVSIAVDTSQMPGAVFYVDPELPRSAVWTYSPVPAAALHVLSNGTPGHPGQNMPPV